MLEEYKSEHGEVMRLIADRGTYFAREDIESFFDKSLPGMDEVMAIIRIADLLRAKKYDLIILDTAPTGHTLVLLSLPEKMEKWVHIMDMLMAKHRYIMKTMVGRYKKDKGDDFIDSQMNDIKRVKGLLGNAKSTVFVPVTIPEPMSIYEVEKAVKTLKKYRIMVNTIIVNRIIQGNSKCPFCSARRQEKEKYMREIEEKFAPYTLVQMPLFPYQIRGMKRLTEYAGILSGEKEYIPPTKSDLLPTVAPLSKGKLSDIMDKELKFVIFGGKGGVGKTSIAAASALYLARHKPDKKMLAFSNDPAHSLSDSFKQHIGNKITRISSVDNLYALEIDGTQMLEDFKQVYRDDIDEAFEKFLGGGGVDIKFDREVLGNLLAALPPGLEELMALRKIIELMKDRDYDLFILDSAASGHLIRFLELPHLIQEWVTSILKLLLKYRGTVKLTKAAESLLDLSRDIKRILTILADPQQTEFVIITIPEQMALAEMEDLGKAVSSLKIPCSHTVVNMIIPATECDFCAAKRKEQQKYIQEIEAKLSDYTIVPIPMLPHEISGLQSLSELGEIMYGG